PVTSSLSESCGVSFVFGGEETSLEMFVIRWWALLFWDCTLGTHCRRKQLSKQGDALIDRGIDKGEGREKLVGEGITAAGRAGVVTASPPSDSATLERSGRYWAQRSWRQGTALTLIDPTLQATSRSRLMRCLHIGLLCVQENPEERPTMASVVAMLTCHSLTLPDQI
ncbi:hypothetical protein Ancab_005705, partial [Ancistrocladus abbreviatus]